MLTQSFTYPARLYRTGSGMIGIEWSDGKSRVYAARDLRERCPCAGCASERRADAESPATDASLEVTEMSPVGNYAYKVVFSDGHSTGIFPLDLLRSLGRDA